MKDKMKEHYHLDRDSLEKLMKIRPRSALEVLLVVKGIKPGDFIRKYKDGWRDIFEILKKIKALSLIERPEMVLYYNPEFVGMELIEKLQAIKNFNPKKDIIVDPKDFEDYTEILGKFFGYPDCCIKSYLRNNTITRYKPGTEHLWCSDDCQESKEIQKKVFNLVQDEIPQIKDLTEEFGNLP